MSNSVQSTRAQHRTFLGHPRGLLNLAGIEMWERFSYYGLLALLVYYLYHSTAEGGLGLDKQTSVSIVGAYGGMVYLTSVAGAWVADRVLSPQRTLLFSALIVMIGHISLAAFHGLSGVILGLSCIALGAGSVKTTSQVVLSELYQRGDGKRDGGFSIYYMGINIGALIAPIITNALWGWKGFHWGFAAAAAFMAIGSLQFLLTRASTIGEAGLEVPNPISRAKLLPILAGTLLVLAAFASLFIFGVLPLARLANVVVLVPAAIAAVLWVQMYRSPLVSAEERSRLLGFVPMFFAAVAFWSIFNQQSTVLAVYSDERLNRTIFGHELPPGVIKSINPLFIICFSAVFAAIWTKLGRRQPSYATKFSMSLALIAIAVLIFLPFAGSGANSTPFLVIVGILFIFTLAELMLSPVGNSMATQLAPKAFPTRMFALWIISMSLGTALSGSFAQFYDPTNAQAERTYFLVMFGITATLALVVFALRKWVERKFIDVH
ncbi:peptide MFS transporter [Corynebacterium gerontici]|uniref:Di-/tripeptide transporter n=1 Tax=Corynebacterium gerontici TaxID=2079234 RepID=A0A3G6IYB3_9CORY|nr:oligopeptide:H+ symporter [Corynebacterium gerontici]AZA10771.1 Di-/tripeptide transporter [Corynebacterium gerontici]